MRRALAKRSKKAGLPPGTLVHLGEQPAQKTRIEVFDFDKEHWESHEIESIEDCHAFRDERTVTWINIEGLQDIPLLESIGTCFGMHPLALEDILNTDQRPKTEDYGGFVYVVLRMFYFRPNSKEFLSEQISIVFGKDFVITFQERPKDVLDSVRERIRTGKGRVRTSGADYLAYAIIDAIVDGYFAVLEQLGETIEELETLLMDEPDQHVLREIHRLKRELLFFRKSVWPVRELINSLRRDMPGLIQKETGYYLRDVHDHSIQVIDVVETLREILSGMLDIYLSSVSNRMNSVMKVLTIIATIFIPLTFIAGIYGMNFKFMPELDWKWSYPVLWGIMITIFLGMLAYFRKKEWL